MVFLRAACAALIVASSAALADGAHVHCTGGLAGSFPCSNVDLLAQVPLPALGGGGGADIWGWADPITGKEYAIMLRSTGTSFVDLSDPASPVLVGTLPSHTGASTWRDAKTYANHAYIVSEAGGHGMQVFDLGQLRDVISPPVVFSETAHYGEFGNAHNIVMNEDSGFAYAVGSNCFGGLHMIDLQNPAAPSFAGCYDGDFYTHDAQCVNYGGPDPDYAGRELCFNSNEDTVTIVDVTDKSNPVMITRDGYPGASYVHQGWLTEDHRYLLIDDEGDEFNFGHGTRTRILDVTDVDNPFVSGIYDSTALATDHNQYTYGDYVYQANYRAGLRILSLTDIDNGNLSELAYFDVYPANDNAGFDGAWSVYPYFQSGVVIVSSIEGGLFVLWPTSLAVGFQLNAADAVLDVCGANASVSTEISVSAQNGYTGNVTLAATGLPAGVTASFNPPSIAVPGSSTMTLNLNGAMPGTFPIAVGGDDGELATGTTTSLNVAIGPPLAAAALLPADGASGVSAVQTLYWSDAQGAGSYDIELAADASFSNVVATATGLPEAIYIPPSLNGGSTYHWRIASNNACGTVVSPVMSFSTSATECSVLSSTDVPKIIPDNNVATVTSNLQIDTAEHRHIVDIDLEGLQITHSYIDDLDVSLSSPTIDDDEASPASRHPENTTVLLMDRPCGFENDISLSLDDEATGTWSCPPTDGGRYQPDNALAGFDGVHASGQWTLVVRDHFGLDGGSIDAWGVSVCTTSEPELLDTDADGVENREDNCLAVYNPTQCDADGDGFGNSCDADFDQSGLVSFADLSTFRAAFGSDDAVADLDCDGIVGFSDLSLLTGLFGEAPGPSAQVTRSGR